MTTKAELIVFGGLPGVGKTTITREVATRIGACYLRIDIIEQAILRSVKIDGGIGPVGYLVGQELALANLSLGIPVIADAVNAVEESRDAWRAVARQARVDIVEVEVICSEADMHRRRVETRLPDIEGHKLPSWAKVRAMTMEPWERPHIVIDTAALSVDEAAKIIDDAIG